MSDQLLHERRAVVADSRRNIRRAKEFVAKDGRKR